MTLFTTLYPFIRAAIGDTGSVALVSNDLIDSLIACALQDDTAWRLNSHRAVTYSEVSPVPVGGRAITPDWQDARDCPILYYSAALVAVSTTRVNAGHKAGRMEIRRGGGPWDLVTYLEKMLDRARRGTFNVLAWSEWNAVFLRGTAPGIAQLMSFPG